MNIDYDYFLNFFR